MDSLSIKTYAKINLTLDVTEKREDGYHNIDSIFEEISLCDTVTISHNNSGIITVSCDDPEIPCNESNIVYKAAECFFTYTGIKNEGIHIDIHKNIPSQAGMGGGSTNAAGVLKLLNQMYNTDLTDDELMEIGLKTGADTPFFIKGGICHITGIGEIITPLEKLPPHFIVVAKGIGGISTPAAYKKIDSLVDAPHHNTRTILEAVKQKDINSLMRQCINTFELADIPEDVIKIKNILKNHNPANALMTGSGSAVFGIFTDKDSAEAALCELKNADVPFTGIFFNV